MWESQLDEQYEMLKDIIRKGMKKFKNKKKINIDVRFIISNDNLDIQREMLERLFKIDEND